jgi:hypothetical protein
MNSGENIKTTVTPSRVQRSPAFVASLYQGWERAFENSVRAALDASEEAVASLGLCLRPRNENWAADVSEIANACGLDVGRLAAFLRQAFAVEAFAGAPPAGDVVDGRLLAARDRGQEDDE